MLLTGAAVLAAVVIVTVLQLLPRAGGGDAALPGTRTTAGILVPASGTNTALANGRDLGLATAPLTLTVWSDFQCPACQVFVTSIEPQLIRDYVDKGRLRLVYRDHPIIGPESVAAASAARCADQQGRFWQYHDVLFANQAPENSGSLTPQRLKDMADAVGLDRGKFDACLPSTDIFNAVQAESRQGDGRGSSTPTLDFGGDRVIAGSPPYDQLKTRIDTLLAAAGTQPSAPAGASPSGT